MALTDHNTWTLPSSPFRCSLLSFPMALSPARSYVIFSSDRTMVCTTSLFLFSELYLCTSDTSIIDRSSTFNHRAGVCHCCQDYQYIYHLLPSIFPPAGTLRHAVITYLTLFPSRKTHNRIWAEYLARNFDMCQPESQQPTDEPVCCFIPILAITLTYATC